MHGDVLVYDDHGYYRGLLGDDGVWYRWPAERNGWLAAVRSKAPTSSEACFELPPELAKLALLLSGVTDHA